MIKHQDVKIIFMGTPQLAADILSGLLAAGYPISSVVTRIDKPKGRSGEAAESPVKAIAIQNKISVFQPQTKLELEELIRKEKPDLVVVTAFGMIITAGTLAVPKFGAINVHPSLLPKYRGPWPIGAPILNGDKTTGATIMLMSEGMDEGDILAQKEVSLAVDETTPSLTKKLGKLSLELLLDTLPRYLAGDIKPQKQDNVQANYMKMVKKEDGKLDFKNQTADQIERMSRAYLPWPGVYTFWNGKKIELSEISITKDNIEPGKVEFENDKLLIGTKVGAISPRCVKLEGKNLCEMPAFLRGYPDFKNTRFN